MNAVEIEQAVSDLVEAPFDRESFAFSFLEAFGNKATTIKKLKVDRSKKGSSNKSDLEGGVLQTKNIHLLVCDEGQVGESLKALVDSPETAKRKVKYALATDGKTIEAANIVEGETLACDFEKLADNFGFFLALAGITTVKEIRNNSFDIKATSRLNRLYVELLRHNPDWDTAERREEMNHFFARLIFCFFAEDTGIFNGSNLFTTTVEQMSDSKNAHEILTELFRAMNTSHETREGSDLRPYASKFPYVNGGLFSGSPEAPKFTKIARSYLIHVGHLDWTQINPDIFGSMIQAVADDEERGALGMHYTSVPNILKVLNPLFLDDLRTKLEEAGDNKRKLLNLRNRMARIRVFDPACGSGNFLVIAYKEMREIEAKINKLRGEDDRRSDIPLTNFRGIELRNFSAEIARLALIIAEYQCDVLHRGQKLALLEFLPLDAQNWITCGNAIDLDWLKICPPTGTGVKITGDDLFNTPLDQTEMDFDNEGGEIFICGNPPYKGRNKQSTAEKAETKKVFSEYKGSYASLDYVANWVILAAKYCQSTNATAGLVATNSICQGEQVALLWPLVFDGGLRIHFAHTSFQWSNLAADKAGVTVVIVGLSANRGGKCKLFSGGDERTVESIGPYLVPNSLVYVEKIERPISNVSPMYLGNMAKDGGHLLMTLQEGRDWVSGKGVPQRFVRKFFGSQELIHAKPRACLWLEDDEVENAIANPTIAATLKKVAEFRDASPAASTRKYAKTPHRFVQKSAVTGERAIVIPRVSSHNRPFLPVDYFQSGAVIGDKCYAIYDQALSHLALICSSLHIVWIGTVCSRLRTDFSYGNKLGWNTFPVPTLTEQNQRDLTECAEAILLAREAHFPATIADLYDPENMPSNLREAHERNDETLERIYIGRRFKNDTERLEKLFEMYTKMTSKDSE